MKIKEVGYAIFRRHPETNVLWSISESSFSMPWSRKYASVSSTPPNKNRFKPEFGDFIVKTTRKYDDIEFIGYTGNRSNFEWRLK